MKHYAKALSMLLAIIMVVGLLPLSVFAEDIHATHTVQFKLNYNGAGKIASQTVADGECATEPEDATREGWILKGWYTKKNGGDKFDFSAPVTTDVTLYAQWDEDIEYWGRIWGNNIVGMIEKAEKEGENKENPGDESESLTYDELILEQQKELDIIEELNGGKLPNITLDEEDYIPSFIIGAYSDEIVTDYKSAIESLKDIMYLMRFENVEKEFVGQQINEFDGTKYYRLQQMYDGYLVYGKQLIVTTDDDGNIASLSGDYDPLQGVLNTDINITEAEAYTIISAEGYSGDADTELVIYTLDGYNEFAWLFESSYTYLVSAVDGTILLSFTNIITDTEQAITEQTIGRGDDENGKTATFNTRYDTVTKKFYFHDMIRNILYHDLVGSTYMNRDGTINTASYLSHGVLEDSDNIWNSSKAITLNKNLTNVYDYYFNTIGLRSYDGKNGAIYAFVDDGMHGQNNAWNCGPFSTNGVNRTILSFSTKGNNHRKLDTVAHEFTHAIQGAWVPGCVYSGETGALMEAYSDIGGELAELYTNGTVDWIHGARNMIDPTSNSYPKKYNGSKYYTGSEDNGGVHKNSTVISHVAYEIYSNHNGISDVEILTELYFRAWNYLSSTADFLEYRSAMLAAAGNMHLTTEQISVIMTAFDDADIVPEDYDPWLFTTVTVNVSVIDSHLNAIPNAIVRVNEAVGNKTVAETYCDASGMCTINLRGGNYIITISATGYIEDRGFYSFNVTTNTTLICKLTDSSEQIGDSKSEIGGKITDAMTGEALSGVTVNFRKGHNITSGRSAVVLTTETDGRYYTDNLEYGYYTVELIKDGYIRSYFVVQAASTNWSDDVRNQALNQNISLSPYIDTNDTIRIVLTWGENPSDLDSHITGTLSDGNSFHLYFGNKNVFDTDGSIVANLDIDDVSSYGPETTTLHWSEGVEYAFNVHLFSGNGTLSSSSANIKIYSGSALIHNIDVPSGSENMQWWRVFIFEDGDFTFINSFSNSLN